MIKTFKNSYVAFIDVLGFRNLVMNDDEKLRKYFETIKKVFEIFTDQKAEIKKWVFSDSVILVIEENEDNFKTILRAIRNLQAWLAIENIWMRGALTRGDVCIDDDLGEGKIIYGKGFVRAFDLEKKAIYPRVIIDPGLINVVSENKDEFLNKYSSFYKYARMEVLSHEEIKNDSDKDYIYAKFNQMKTSEKSELDGDIYFINYSSTIINDGLVDDLGESMNKLLDNLKKEIYSDYYQKYNWVKKYFLDNLTNFDAKYSKGNYSIVFQRRIYKWRQELLKL
jgi:hypothetical protein